MKQSLTFTAVVIGALLGASALSVLAQTSGTWTAAPSNPPSNNVPAPLNVGPYAQIKTGLLGLDTLDVNYLNVASGTVSMAGSVLTNNGNGYAVWAPASSGSVGSSQSLTIGVTGASYWWNHGFGSNIGTSTCPAGYYMSGVVQAGGCSGGYCGINIVCNHF